MIQLAIALLVGFLIGWLIFLKKDVSFSASAAVVLLAFLESLSYGWLLWRKQLLEAKPQALNPILIWRSVVATVFGIVIISFGESIGKDLSLVAVIPIASFFLLNLYKIVSKLEK